MNATDHIEVFYLNARDGWACAEFDGEGNQIGEAAIVFHKKDAIREARACAGAIYPIRVFNKYGEQQRTINTANA